MSNATANWATLNPSTGKIGTAYATQSSAALYRSYEDQPEDWLILPHGWIADHLIQEWRKSQGMDW